MRRLSSAYAPRFPGVLTQEEAMTLQEPTASSECDFKIIDDNRHMPLASHLYLFELVAVPDLKKMLSGALATKPPQTSTARSL